MKYFKDENNQVHAFEEDALDTFIPGNLIAITEAEANKIRFPPKSNAELADELKQQLDAMEREAIIPRGLRESELMATPLLVLLLSTLTPEQKVALATIKTQLSAANPFYMGLEATDATAADLRAQIRELK